MLHLYIIKQKEQKMNKITTSAIAIILFLFISLITVSTVMAGTLKKGPLSDGPLSTTDHTISWSGWNNYPNTNIFYRVQLQDVNTGNTATVAVEIMNNYKKDVSFAIALNDNELNAPYLPVYKLHKNKTTIVNYPKPKEAGQLFAFIRSVEVE
jgi:hypothetical protein